MSTCIKCGEERFWLDLYPYEEKLYCWWCLPDDWEGTDGRTKYAHEEEMRADFALHWAKVDRGVVGLENYLRDWAMWVFP